ncbi:hypothetical protein FHG89_31650 [Micromonospora orduensis]|uniref:Uncharacterized protein n=1 Tax=Micromonospora orduensis TaxID=1420891 RepID=A0A5C4QBS8_9ACTN|nr:hypothetical protein FHG89_31650 [Micromonospora orduensis]
MVALLRKLRRQPQKLLDETGPATRYLRRDGNPTGGQLQDDRQTVILNRPLLTRAGEMRASYAMRNRGEHFR